MQIIRDTFDPEIGPIVEDLSKAPIDDLFRLAIEGYEQAWDALKEKGLNPEEIILEAMTQAAEESLGKSKMTGKDDNVD